MYLIHPFSPWSSSPPPSISIIPFSNPSDCITCPKNPNFLFSAVCCSVSSSYIPISMRTLSLVFFCVHDILPPNPHLTCVDLFFLFLSLSTSQSHTELSGKSVSLLSFF